MILYNKIVPVSFGELYDRVRERERSEKWSAGNGSLSWCIYRRIDHGTGQVLGEGRAGEVHGFYSKPHKD